MTTLPTGIFTIQAQERVVFGLPAAQAVVDEARRLGAKRVFLTTGRSLAGLDDGPVQRIAKALGAAHAGTYVGLRAHTPREDVIAGAHAAREAGADLLVAIGGGSAIDGTKAMLMCLWMGLGDTASMEAYRQGADASVARSIAAPPDAIRMLAVSTTLSASEFTPSAGVTESSTHAKQSFRHPLFVPRSVVLDPACTLHTPDELLFGTAIRAVDHAVESYCSNDANPATEVLSLAGLRLLSDALPRIHADKADLRARLDAQFGMWQSISPSAAGVRSGASHGIGYALGATFAIPHGHTSCVMLPAVLKWNAALNGERQKALSQAMGAPDREASELVGSLIGSLGLPRKLRDVGIGEDRFAEIAERSLVYAPVKLNPRPIRSAADVMEILALAR